MARIPFFRLLLFCLALVAATMGCGRPEGAPSDAQAQAVVDSAIAAHGGDAYNPSRIGFTFRGERYLVELDGGRYAYTRHYTANGRTIEDRLDNGGLQRRVDGQPVALADSTLRSARSTANSVPYFVLLPYRLNDPAVRKTDAGADTLAGEPYRRVAVAFEAEGGGPDFRDRYLFWFHRRRHTLDFLAYTFDGGTRFRAAQNPRTVGGIRFADYLNLTAPDSLVGGDLARYGDLFRRGLLDTVSVVAITDVVVGQ